MAPSIRDLQLVPIAGQRRPDPISARTHSDDLEDVRLLDSYDEEAAAPPAEKGLRRIQVKVTGMTCSACTNSVESAIAGLRGVSSASVSLLQNRAHVVFDPELVTDEDIKEAIEDAGFEAEILPDSTNSRSKAQNTLSSQFRIGGMTCTNCVNSVEGILIKLPGVKKAVVALATSLGEVQYDPSVISKDEIVLAVEDAGFDAAFLQSSEQDKTFLGVSGLSTEADAHILQQILREMKGIQHFEVNSSFSEVEVIFDPEALGLRSIVDGIDIASNGKFKVNIQNPYTRAASSGTEESSRMFRLFMSSLFLTVLIFLIRMVFPHMPYLHSFLLLHFGPFMMSDLLTLVFSSIAQFVIGKKFYVAAYRALRNGSTNMDVLVALGTSASYFYSVCALIYGAVTGFWSMTYFETGAMIFTFVLLGKYLEVVAKGKTSDAIKKLVELAPVTAILLMKDAEGRYAVEREIDALLIQPGDVLKVLPGSKVPSDGMVVWGTSYIDESMVTGESLPILKEVSSSVIGGTMNLHGALHVRATKVGSSTVLSQIISLVETAQMSKAPIQKFADYNW